MSGLGTALRIQRRVVDTVRVALHASIERSETIEVARNDLAERLRNERAIASDWMAASDEWCIRMRAQGDALAIDAAFADAQLAQLRRLAAEAYGQLRALEHAAQNHADEEARAALAAEQDTLDDIAAIALLRRRRAAAGKRT